MLSCSLFIELLMLETFVDPGQADKHCIHIFVSRGGACFGASRGYFENRDLNERVNKLKLKMFTEATPLIEP
eukprot:4203526-Amphidinium_carterae.1